MRRDSAKNDVNLMRKSIAKTKSKLADCKNHHSCSCSDKKYEEIIMER